MRRRQHKTRYTSKPAAVAMRARSPRRRRRLKAKRASTKLGRSLLVIVAVVFGLMLLGGGGFALVWYLHQSPEYVVHDILVDGASLLTPDEVIEQAGLQPGKPILKYDIRRARSRLMDHPMIHDATVTRRLPNTLAVSIVERAPVARLKIKRTEFLVDRDGFLLTECDGQETLPLIEGVYVRLKEPKSGMRVNEEKLDEKLAAGLLIVRLCGTSPTLNEIGIDRVDVHNLSHVELYPNPGPRVLPRARVDLGDRDFGRRLARLAEALKHSAGKRLKKASLQNDNRVNFVFE